MEKKEMLLARAKENQDKTGKGLPCYYVGEEVYEACLFADGKVTSYWLSFSRDYDDNLVFETEAEAKEALLNRDYFPQGETFDWEIAKVINTEQTSSIEEWNGRDGEKYGTIRRDKTVYTSILRYADGDEYELTNGLDKVFSYIRGGRFFNLSGEYAVEMVDEDAEGEYFVLHKVHEGRIAKQSIKIRIAG